MSPLEGYPVVLQRAVAWGEMDAFAHVNNTVYFRYFEDVRIAYFERVGLLAHQEKTGVGPILARTQAVFRKPLAYPADIEIGARVEDVGADRFTMIYRVVSAGEVVCDGDGRIVVFDYGAGQKAPLPDAVRAAMDALSTA